MQSAPRAGVLLPVPLRGAYDYKLPKGTNVLRGLLVNAPLGPREQLGVVWGDAEGTVGDNRLKEAVPLAGAPALPEKLCDFVEWVAQYTLAPQGMILAMALRGGRAFEPEALRTAFLRGTQTPTRMTPARRRVLAIAADGLARKVPEIAEQAGVSSAVVRGLIDAGALIATQLPEFERFGVPDPNFSSVVLNEKQNAGRPIGPYALGYFLILAGSLFMRGGTFSLLASVVFYNVFFARERQRPILHTNLVASLALAGAAMLLRVAVLHQGGVTGPMDTGAFLRNLPGYLVLMVFPLHQSQLLSTAPAWVRGVYALAPYIRVVVGLSLLSYSLFGFIFGNRTIRFYIAWMYVMVVPFSVFRYPSDWLNLRFLYLVSLAFCVLLTTGTLYAFKLLSQHRLRRCVPFLIPAFYVALSVALVIQLDHKNEIAARDPTNGQALARISALLER